MKEAYSSKIYIKCQRKTWVFLLILTMLFNAPVRAAPDEFIYASNDIKRRAMLDQIREQALAAFPTHAILSSWHVTANAMHNVKEFIGIDSEFSDENNLFASFFNGKGLGLGLGLPDNLKFTPGYHHNNRLMPWHDALIFGFQYKQNLWRDRAELEVKPFYGQGWTRASGMFGAETSVRFTDEDQNQIAALNIRYDGGDPALTENSRGYDVHGEWGINQRLSFNVGTHLRENESGGSYALLRWQMAIE